MFEMFSNFAVSTDKFMRKILFAISCLIILTGCSSKGGSTQPAEDGTDSVATVIEKIAEIAWLPDTAYPSAMDVVYSLEIIDSVDGHISSLKDLYADAPGTFTFRKGLKRQADYRGRIKGEPTDVRVDWSYQTNRSTIWGGGSGWTGQPLYVEWPDSCLQSQNVKAKKEIIVGSLDGTVHFIDYADGKQSRKPVGNGNPIKGTISLDPTLNGNLYVGEGVPDTIPFGAYVIDLNQHKLNHFWGPDPKAPRRWFAYDSSPLRIDRFLFRPGENGCFYKFVISPGNLRLQSALRYTVDGVAPGIESSMAVYANYGFVADNRGNVIAINLDTMKPVWLVRLGDDIDSTIVLEVEEDTPYIYACTEIDKQGMEGKATFAKIRATDGTVIWTRKFDGCRAENNSKMFDGGFYATPLLGTADCNELIFNSLVLNTNRQNGEVVALNRKTGETLWSAPLPYYGWSSPVSMTSDDGKMYLIVGDGAGNINIFSGIDGRRIVSKNIGHNFESSPVVIDSAMVVGTRGQSIYRLTVTSTPQQKVQK